MYAGRNRGEMRSIVLRFLLQMYAQWSSSADGYANRHRYCRCGARRRGFASHGVTYEMFPMHGRETGISIPADVIDELGESTIDKVLGSFTYIDLWSGRVRGEQKA